MSTVSLDYSILIPRLVEMDSEQPLNNKQALFQSPMKTHSPVQSRYILGLGIKHSVMLFGHEIADVL